jgi:radical SAM-linked protein
LGTIPVTARVPWDHVDVGLEEGFLAREYRKALGDQLSPPCGKVAGTFVHATNLQDAQTDARKLVCYDCGIACDLSTMREQRLVYLRKLRAEAPRPPSVRERRSQRLDPVPLERGQRYRFVYEKLGPAAFLSHLDLIRALPRAFRRLGLPLFYSKGFHPKPVMAFGPALSLGVASMGEVVDIEIAADIDPSAMLDELSQGTHDGLRFVGGARLAKEDPPITRVIDTARYVVGIPRALQPYGDRDWLQSRIESARGGRPLTTVRRIDGIGKHVDVAQYLRGIDLCDEAADELRAAGWVGDLQAIAVEVEIRGSGAVKISEVVETVFGGPDVAHRAVRAALGKRLPTGALAAPLDLLALRPIRSTPQIAAAALVT